VEIGLDEVNGVAMKEKQGSISRAARERGIKVQTSRNDGRLYARLKVFPK
jgi:hypothetical protein